MQAAACEEESTAYRILPVDVEPGAATVYSAMKVGALSFFQGAAWRRVDRVRRLPG
jgi:hypothetical protein